MTPEQVGNKLIAALGASAPTSTAALGASAPTSTTAAETQAPDRPAPEQEPDGAPALRASVSGGGAYARATVDVPVDRWRDAVRAARDDLGCDFFDWLTAVDEGDQGFDVVAHVWSTADRYSLLLRTRIPRDAPAVPSVIDLYPGASWHERETHEMFGIDVTGHPNLARLLLSDEFSGHPLRKEFVLASRVAKPWPGAKEPGEGESSGRSRQPMRPPGVPDPSEWGPQATAR